MIQFIFLNKILWKNESLINFLSKNTVLNYSNALILQSENVKIVEVANFSTIDSFTPLIIFDN